MDLSRVVEVVCEFGTDRAGRWSVGSGYLMNARVVLTAAHVVAGAERIWVRFGGRDEFEAAPVLITPRDVDLALVEFSSGPLAGQATPCATVARNRPGQIDQCRAVGFPQFKELTRDGGPKVRDSFQVDGYIPIAEGLISGYLTLRADARPRARTGESEWAGISGAGVFAGDLLVGVVTEHHLAEGEGSLTVTPLDRLRRTDDSTQTTFWAALGLAGDGLPEVRPTSASPPVMARPSSRLALPHELGDFTGRHGEIERIVALVTDSAARAEQPVVVIWGQPGVGKSRLAVQVAHALVRNADGAFLIDLQGYSSRRLSAENAAGQLLGALAPQQDPPSDPQTLLAACRDAISAGRYVVVLDNANSAEQVRSLLPGCGESIVLITSRSPLPTLDVTLVELDLLDDAAAILLIRRMLERDGARAPETDEDLAELVALCGNLPLALRIAGALLRGRPDWSAKYFNRRLRDETRRLGLLQRDDQAVRTVFESAFAELDDVERELFALLGSIRAIRIAPWMAAALLDIAVEDAEELVERLVDTQVLLTSGKDLTGGPRYRFHDLMRLFAREKMRELDPERLVQAEQRLLSGYLRLLLAFTHDHPLAFEHDVARSVDAPWCPSLTAILTPDDPMEWLLEERNDIVAEIEHASARGQWRYVWGLANIVDPVFVLTGHGSQSLHVKELALAAARSAGDVQAEMNVRFSFVGLLLNERKHEQAIAELTQLQSFYEQRTDLLKSAHVDQTLGVVQRDWGQLRLAEKNLDRSLVSYSRAGVAHSTDVVVRGLHAAALQNLAIIYRELGRLREADALLSRCLASFEELDDVIAFGRSLHTRGVLHAYVGEYDRAESMYRQADTLCRAVGDRRWTGMVVLGLARLAGRRQQWEQMFVGLDECEELFTSISDDQGLAQVMRSRGSALRRMGRLDEAAGALRTAHDTLVKFGDRRSHGRIHYTMALLEIDRGRWEASLAELASADQQFNDDDDAPWRCRVRVTTLRAQTQDLTGRCCTAEDLAGLSAELDQFATLAGDGFLPLWISTARRRFGLSTP